MICSTGAMISGDSSFCMGGRHVLSAKHTGRAERGPRLLGQRTHAAIRQRSGHGGELQTVDLHGTALRADSRHDSELTAQRDGSGDRRNAPEGRSPACPSAVPTCGGTPWRPAAGGRVRGRRCARSSRQRRRSGGAPCSTTAQCCGWRWPSRPGTRLGRNLPQYRHERFAALTHSSTPTERAHSGQARVNVGDVREALREVQLLADQRARDDGAGVDHWVVRLAHGLASLLVKLLLRAAGRGAPGTAPTRGPPAA